MTKPESANESTPTTVEFITVGAWRAAEPMWLAGQIFIAAWRARLGYHYCNHKRVFASH